MKMLKNGKFRHVSELQWNINPFFKPKLKPKICLLNRLPEGPVADVALEGLGARVDALVPGELRRPREGLVAVGAPVRELPACRYCNRLNLLCKKPVNWLNTF